jgi:hypothetical protein
MTISEKQGLMKALIEPGGGRILDLRWLGPKRER